MRRRECVPYLFRVTPAGEIAAQISAPGLLTQQVLILLGVVMARVGKIWGHPTNTIPPSVHHLKAMLSSISVSFGRHGVFWLARSFEGASITEAGTGRR